MPRSSSNRSSTHSNRTLRLLSRASRSALLMLARFMLSSMTYAASTKRVRHRDARPDDRASLFIQLRRYHQKRGYNFVLPARIVAIIVKRRYWTEIWPEAPRTTVLRRRQRGPTMRTLTSCILHIEAKAWNPMPSTERWTSRLAATAMTFMSSPSRPIGTTSSRCSS